MQWSGGQAPRGRDLGGWQLWSRLPGSPHGPVLQLTTDLPQDVGFALDFGGLGCSCGLWDLVLVCSLVGSW